MLDLIRVWRSTRMVVLIAVSAALYAAVLIPFKAVPIIPGATELRPANALPIVFSFLFGPAGAWGSAFGNLIGDTFGTLGPGTLFGFVGNLLYGYLPYRLWGAWSTSPIPTGTRGWAGYVCAALTASGACALVIGWGLHLLGFVPFRILSAVILVNNVTMSLLLSPFLLVAVYPRVGRWGLLHGDILEETSPPARAGRRLAGFGVGAAVLGGLLAGHLMSVSAPLLGIPGDPMAALLLPAVLALFAFSLKA